MGKKLTIVLLLLGLVSFCTFNACDKDEDSNKTLYDRLGGITAISSVVDLFIANIKSDNMINKRFAATIANPSRVRLLRLNLIDRICTSAGGPCTIKGLSLEEADKNMKISQAEFDALLGNLVAALDQSGVPQEEKDELLALLSPMKTEMVGQ